MKLREIKIKGFKSIGEEQTIPLGDVTVLLGANGAGKSNVVSFFKMLQYITKQDLKLFVAKQGINRLLHYGSKKTNAIEFKAHFDDGADNYYSVNLPFGLPDNLFVNYEQIAFGQKSSGVSPTYHLDDAGNTIASESYFLNGENGESGLMNDTRATSRQLNTFLSEVKTYQFHDTSETAKIKDRILVDDARSLHHDGGNLAAFLRMLQTAYPKHYERIVRRIQTVMPQFGRFDLEPLAVNKDYVRLNWYDTSGSQYLLDPHQISDGSLRFMALAALLLQPKELLPSLIVLDEPELGLHPAAIAELAGMVRIASQNTQVLLATQSTRLVDEFELENIVVVERNAETNSTEYKKLDAPQLEEWLERYSLSELWEKNVLGGQP